MDAHTVNDANCIERYENRQLRHGAEGNRTLDLCIANASLYSRFNDLEAADSANTREILQQPVTVVHKRGTRDPRSGLTDYQVTQIRTQRLTDTHWARVLRVRTSTIRDARIGKRYQYVITPPDVAPRDGTGRGGTVNPNARPAKVRRQWK